MIAAAWAFASMGVCVKFASAYFNSAELVGYRGVVSMVLVAAVARARGVSLQTHWPGMHAWRATIGVISLGAWFYAIAHLPLATAMTLNYMSSVWIAAFLVGGSILLGPAQAALRQGPLLATVLLGFVGVVMLLQPTLDQDQMFAGLLGLLSGMTAALAYLQVTALGRLGEPDDRTVFYFALGSALAGGLGMLWTGLSPWDWRGAVWIIPIGVLATLGQLCMTRAYSQGATLVVANLQYSGIVFAALYSLLLFGDPIAWVGWAGMGLIIVSGVAATVLRSRAVPRLSRLPGEEH